MTNLEKKIQRKTRGAYRVLYQQPRQIIAALCPGDLLEFREHGRRARFTLPIDAAFKLAVRIQAAADAAERKKQRKERRKAARYGA